MSVTQVGPTDDQTKPIAAGTMNTTKAAGLGAIAITVGGGLVTVLETLPSQRASVVIAVLATIAVAMAVFAYVAVADMRVRNRQTVADNYLRYLRDRPDVAPAAPAAPQRNGQGGFLMVPGVPTRLAQLLVVVPDMEEGEQLMPFLAGNGAERPG